MSVQASMQEQRPLWDVQMSPTSLNRLAPLFVLSDAAKIKDNGLTYNA